MATLPMDIIATEILPRLPVKSLLRFKCVSKYLQTLISSPEFVDLHLPHSLSSDSNSILILVEAYSNRFYFRHTCWTDYSTFALSFLHDQNFIIGSCNGLLCIGKLKRCNESSSSIMMILLNPSTRSYKEIPLECEPGWSYYENYGFGFDSVSDDYKVVRIKDHFGPITGNFIGREVRIYSCKTDSWREVEFTRPKVAGSSSDGHGYGGGILLDNYLLHWISWDFDECKCSIPCYDLRNERWADDVPCPADGDDSDEKLRIDLRVLDGCLCLLLTRAPYPMGGVVDVWIMKEYGVKESWTKLVSLLESIYCKGSRNELFFMDVATCHRFKLYSYNRYKGTKSRPIHDITSIHDVYVCNESLVALPGDTKFEVLKQGVLNSVVLS